MNYINEHGHLSVADGRVVDEHGRAFVLKGMSLFWSQWIPKYYTPEAIRWLRDDWGVNAIRAPLAVTHGGYTEHPETERKKIVTVVEAAIALGLYVVVDWHAHECEREKAAEFFDWLSATYRHCPNLVYEVWNEPFPEFAWSSDIKPYHEAITGIIRANGARNLIVLGTQNYSKFVDVAADDPVAGDNIAYALHFYAADHRQGLRNKCLHALNKGLALIATEYGTCECTGDGRFDPEETGLWWDFLDAHGIGHFNWSLADKIETAAALQPEASPYGGWSEDALTPSGRLVRNYLRATTFKHQPPHALCADATGVTP